MSDNTKQLKQMSDAAKAGTPGMETHPDYKHAPDHCPMCKVRHFIERFISFADPAHSTAIALWVLHTHVFDGAYTTPYMYVTSTEPGCGKSTVLEACYELARLPMMAGGVSASSLFRSIGTAEGSAPSLFIDEVDTIYSGGKDDDLRQVLNTGYRHRGSIMRTIGGEVVNLSTFAPKMMGGIDNEELPSTVRDRCITIKLEKVRKDKLDIERFLMRVVERDAAALKDELTEWATTELAAKINTTSVVPLKNVSDRQADISEPLMQIAAVLGHATEAREKLTSIFHGSKEQTREHEIMQAAYELFEQTGGDRVTNAMLADATGIGVDRLGRLLGSLGVKARPIRVAGTTVRGYYRNEFDSAFDKYL